MRSSFTKYLKIYFANRPMFLGLIRAKELTLFEENMELKGKPSESDGKVLDFGCGDGFFLETLIKADKKQIKADIIGLDVDKKKAEEAEKCACYQKVVVYHGRKIPYPNSYFDLVISNCVLEHVADLDLVLKEINRVLKSGGQFITTVMTKKWEEYLAGAKIFGGLYKKWMRKIQKHSNLLTANEWQKAFLKAQFKVVKEVGYLDEKASFWIDCFHYLSFYSLLYYKLTGKWVIWPNLFTKFTDFSWFEKRYNKKVDLKKSAALYLILKK